MINHIVISYVVMLVEIPDVGVILSVFGSFVIGLVVVVIYNIIKPRLNMESKNTKILTDRLQYYENLLIDMKIRLDSLELIKENDEPLPVSIPRPKEHKTQQVVMEIKEEKRKERMQNMNFGSATDYVLRLITEKPLTSRDIQITIGRTREHTSRMMKKLFEEGLVERNMQTKPFTYKITDKGLARISLINTIPAQ